MTTERLVLEPLAPAHADEMAPLLDDEELHRYVGGRPLTLDELRKRYELQARGESVDGRQRWLNWIVREQDSGAAVGYVQATVTDGAADVAWVIGSRFQRRGYAREAAAAMVAHLRDQALAPITAHIHPANVASHGVARALGLEPTQQSDDDGEVIWALSYRRRENATPARQSAPPR